MNIPLAILEVYHLFIDTSIQSRWMPQLYIAVKIAMLIMVACIATFQSAIRQTYKLIHACLCMVSSAISFRGYYWEIATHSVNILGRRGGKSINKCHWPWIKVCFFEETSWQPYGSFTGVHAKQTGKSRLYRTISLLVFLSVYPSTTLLYLALHHVYKYLALLELKYSSNLEGLRSGILISVEVFRF